MFYNNFPVQKITQILFDMLTVVQKSVIVAGGCSSHLERIAKTTYFISMIFTLYLKEKLLESWI